MTKSRTSLQTRRQTTAVSTPVKEHGMLFKSPLVRAIANTTPDHQPINDGLPIKWQTRRMLKPSNNAPPPIELEPWIVRGERQLDDNGSPCWAGTHPDYPTGEKWFSPPCGVGDRIWVKEKAKVLEYLEADRRVQLQYESDGAEAWIDYPERLTWTPTSGSYFPRGSLFREAARLVLEVTQVRVQRLQEISEEDAIAEGIESKHAQLLRCTAYRDYGFKPTKFVKEDWLKCPIQSFRTLWNSINQEPGTRWTDNPWVWVYDFKLTVQPALTNKGSA